MYSHSWELQVTWLCYLLWVWRLLPGARASHTFQWVRVTAAYPRLIPPVMEMSPGAGLVRTSQLTLNRLAWMGTPGATQRDPPHWPSRNHGKQIKHSTSTMGNAMCRQGAVRTVAAPSGNVQRSWWPCARHADLKTPPWAGVCVCVYACVRNLAMRTGKGIVRVTGLWLLFILLKCP